MRIARVAMPLVDKREKSSGLHIPWINVKRIAVRVDRFITASFWRKKMAIWVITAATRLMARSAVSSREMWMVCVGLLIQSGDHRALASSNREYMLHKTPTHR